jgi:hypothetical protein
MTSSSKARRAAIGGVAGFVAASAFLASPLMDGTANAGCKESFSKYAPGGSTCVPAVDNDVKKGAATVFFGCMFGSVGGPAAMGYGCAGGVASVLIDQAWG